MRKSTPSFILELPLKINKKEEKELLSRFESARNLYNATLGEAKRKVSLIKQSKSNQKARKLSKKDKNRKELFQITKDKYDFNEYYFHKYIGDLRHKIINNLDIQTTQKLATRAFHSAEKLLYGTAKKVRFKGYNQINSVESKSNDTGIRWRNSKIEWNGLILIPIFDIKDEVEKYGLEHKIKYCRIVRKIIKGKNHFYVQLILEGKPFIKEKNKLGKGTVCFDFGPSTVAIVSENNENYNAELKQFCSELKNKEKETASLQREIDRQRRQNNPKNYTENNKIKKGRLSWKKSKRQIINENKLKELYRITSSHRNSLQGKLVNETLRIGNNFKTEKVSRKWLQKLYGKSVGTRSPGKYISELKRKAESAGGSFLEFPTQTTKLSQTCICGKQKKKKLSERVHSCGCGVYSQRDLFSAFLGIFVEKDTKNEDSYILQTDHAQKAWSSADKLLQTVWQNSIQSTNRGNIPSSFGTKFQSQSRSFAKVGRAEFEIQNVVVIRENNESLKENEVFPIEPTGF